MLFWFCFFAMWLSSFALCFDFRGVAVRNVACPLVCAQSRVSHVWHAADKLRKAHGAPSFICAQSRMSHGRVWHAVETKREYVFVFTEFKDCLCEYVLFKFLRSARDSTTRVRNARDSRRVMSRQPPHAASRLTPPAALNELLRGARAATRPHRMLPARELSVEVSGGERRE